MQNGAVDLTNEKSRSKLDEQRLFQFVAQAVVVGINLREREIDLRGRGLRQRLCT